MHWLTIIDDHFAPDETGFDPDVDTDLPVSYTHLRAHETVLDIVCRLLLEKKNDKQPQTQYNNATHISTYSANISEYQHTT